MNSRRCDNGLNHAHISKGSMKLAHNLDDRQERASVKATPAQVGLASLQGKAYITELIARLRAEKAAREVLVLPGQTEGVK